MIYSCVYLATLSEWFHSVVDNNFSYLAHNELTFAALRIIFRWEPTKQMQDIHACAHTYVPADTYTSVSDNMGVFKMMM
jgi:hypothetical protein